MYFDKFVELLHYRNVFLIFNLHIQELFDCEKQLF